MKEFEQSNQKSEISSQGGSSQKSLQETGGGHPLKEISKASFQELSKPHFFIQKDRMTCTFFVGKEASSIHFDRLRGEIFYNGHNIRNMNLTESQIHSLSSLGLRLLERRQNVDLPEAYQACLQKALSL